MILNFAVAIYQRQSPMPSTTWSLPVRFGFAYSVG